MVWYNRRTRPVTFRCVHKNPQLPPPKSNSRADVPFVQIKASPAREAYLRSPTPRKAKAKAKAKEDFDFDF